MSHGNKTESSESELLSEYLRGDAALADAIGKSKRTIARWRALGEGPPYVLLGREIIYKRDDVLAWLDTRRVEV